MGMSAASRRRNLPVMKTAPPYVSNIENGRTNPTIGQIGAIADALGCTMSLDLREPQLGPEPQIPN